MKPAIRPVTGADINYVRDIDLKSYLYPWDSDIWRKLANDKACYIVTSSLDFTPTGFIVWRTDDDTCQILRLGVKPCARNSGSGSALLSHAEDWAIAHHLASIFMVVPEINCFPGHPDDVSVWLRNRHYKATLPVIEDVAVMYGKHVDGYKFVKELYVT